MTDSQTLASDAAALRKLTHEQRRDLIARKMASEDPSWASLSPAERNQKIDDTLQSLEQLLGFSSADVVESERVLDKAERGEALSEAEWQTLERLVPDPAIANMPTAERRQVLMSTLRKMKSTGGASPAPPRAAPVGKPRKTGLNVIVGVVIIAILGIAAYFLFLHGRN